MTIEVRTTIWGRMIGSSDYFAKLETMRAEYRVAGDRFTQEERRRMEFTKWLIANGRMGR